MPQRDLISRAQCLPLLQFSSSSFRSFQTSQYSRSPLLNPSKQWSSRQRIPRLLNGRSAIRLASTNTSPAPIVDPQIPVAEVQNTVASQDPISTEYEFPSISTQDLTSTDSPPVHEYIGYLKEIGLDYGWGPTSMVETLLEHVHIYTGAPWWASIVMTTFAVRAILFKAYINSADTSARLVALKPLVDPIREKQKAAQAEQDKEALMKASLEMRALYKTSDVKLWKLAIPLLQIPLGFGTFRLLRGMGVLPVPGFDHAGAFWFPDLTLPDPYGLLPLMIGATYFIAFKNGDDAGSTMGKTTRRVLLIIFPCVTGMFSFLWPAALQLTVFSTGIVTLAQSFLFNSPWARRKLGIHPLPTPNLHGGKLNLETFSEKEKQGVAATLKTFGDDTKKTMDNMMAGMSTSKKPKGRLTQAELKHAKDYEAKRQRELAQERFENAQAAAEKAAEKRARRQQLR